MFFGGGEEEEGLAGKEAGMSHEGIGREEVDRVEDALKVLTWTGSNPGEVSGADEYLRGVRRGRGLWNVVAAVVKGGEGGRIWSEVMLQFVAAGVEEQIRVGWGGMEERERGEVFRLGLGVLGEAAKKEVRVAVERGCAAVAICVARVPVGVRKSAWQAAMGVARGCGVQCEMLAALIEEWDRVGTGSAEREKDRREFAKEQCSLAVAEASSVLSKPGAKAAEKNAAVRCLQCWRPYAQRGTLIDVLSTAVLDPLLCEAAGEALEEEVGEGDVGASALVRMCEALKGVLNEAGLNGAQAHVVALTCTAAAEGNIDAMLRGDSADRVEAAATLVSTLLACLLSPTRSTFMAAVDGWGTLAASAAALKEETTSVQVIIEQLPEATALMLSRSKLPLSTDRQFWGDELLVDDAMHFRSAIGDTLLQACMALGCDSFITNLLPHLQEQVKRTSGASDELEALLFALAAAADAYDAAHPPHNVASVLSALSVALSPSVLVHFSSPQLVKTTMTIVASFSELVVTNDELFNAAMQAFARAFKTNPDSAALAVRHLAQAAPGRLMPHCDELLQLYAREIHSMPASASANIAQALALAASELPAAETRAAALSAVAAPPSEQVRLLANGPWEPHVTVRLSASLSAISSAIRAVNDPQAGAHVLRSLAGPLSSIAAANASQTNVVNGVCGLLEAAIAARSSDDEKDRGAPDPAVSREVLNLTTDSLLLSGCSEPRWLGTMARSLTSCDLHSADGHAAASNAIHRVTISVRNTMGETADGTTVSPDLLTEYFMAMNVALIYAPDATIESLSVMSDIALLTLTTDNVRTSREVLKWWQRLLQDTKTLRPVADAVLHHKLQYLLRGLFVAIGGTVEHRAVGMKMNAQTKSPFLTISHTLTRSSWSFFFLCSSLLLCFLFFPSVSAIRKQPESPMSSSHYFIGNKTKHWRPW